MMVVSHKTNSKVEFYKKMKILKNNRIKKIHVLING